MNGFFSFHYDESLAGTFGPPPAATLGPPLRPGDAQFQFNVTGTFGFAYVIETSTDLRNWEPLFTNTPPFVFADPKAASSPRRFYRAVWVP